MELLNCNAIITSPALTPVVFSQMFFTKIGVVEEDGFGQGYIFSDQVCQVQSPRFHFIAMGGGTMQFTPSPDLPPLEQDDLILDIVPKIVRALGQIPFIALGINFILREGDTEQFVNERTQRLFYRKGIAPFTYFTDPDARFGGYMSKDFHGFRLKMEIKPALLQKPKVPPMHSVLFSFNFHKDLDTKDSVGAIEQSLGLWRVAREHSDEIARSAFAGG